MAGLTFLKVVPNSGFDKAEQPGTVDDAQNGPLLSGLAAHVRQCWDAARIAKKPLEDEMLRAMRQRNGEYEADKLRQIKTQGGSDVYMMLTEVKCRAAESWLRDILLDSG